MWDQPRSRAPHCLPDLKESGHLSLAGYKVHQVESFGQRRVISWGNLLRPLVGWSLRNQLMALLLLLSFTAPSTCLVGDKNKADQLIYFLLFFFILCDDHFSILRTKSKLND